MSLPAARQAPKPEKVDPRIHRTRMHVLSVTREMLNEGTGALTFTLVADRALVARQTLYKHWGSIQNLIADTVVITRSGGPNDFDGLDAHGRTTLFLKRIIHDVDTGMAAAIGSIMAAAAYEQESRDAFVKLDYSLYEIFLEFVGPLTHDQYLEIASPVMLSTIGRSEVSPALIDSLARRAVEMLEQP